MIGLLLMAREAIEEDEGSDALVRRPRWCLRPSHLASLRAQRLGQPFRRTCYSCGKLAPEHCRLGQPGVGLPFELVSVSFPVCLHTYFSVFSLWVFKFTLLLLSCRRDLSLETSIKRAQEGTSAPCEPTSKRLCGAPGKELRLPATGNSLPLCLLPTSLAEIVLPRLTFPSFS
jgi:hypothetical protein